MTERLENLERMIRGEVPAPPIAQLIGFKLVAVKRGEARHENPKAGDQASAQLLQVFEKTHDRRA